MADESPEAIAARVVGLVERHEGWRRSECLNMNAAEGTISLGARRLLDSDLATRVTEGLPGDKLFPSTRQNVLVDQIEAILISLARRLFGARYVEWRAVNTSMANALAVFALTATGDPILSQAMAGGANMSYQAEGPPQLRGLDVHDMPFVDRSAAETGEDPFELDLERLAARAAELRPRLMAIGGSHVLFPYPVARLREIADACSATLLYDAAHLGVFLATGRFQDPLAEGAHLVTLSTHKVMGGPVGGLLLTDDSEIAARILELTSPTFLQTRDQNKYAATAYALAEVLAFGEAYADRLVANARALASALETEGLRVLAGARRYTETHQLFVQAGRPGAPEIEDRCARSGILINKARLPWDDPETRSGLRLSVQEITRQGMGEDEMRSVATLMRRAVAAGESDAVSRAVAELVSGYPGIGYTFEP